MGVGADLTLGFSCIYVEIVIDHLKVYGSIVSTW